MGSSETKAAITIEHLYKSYQSTGNEKRLILSDIQLQVREGEMVTIVGHSGCGKSTLLKIISGLVPFDEGTLIRNQKPVTSPDRDCDMVYQEHRLMPWLKVKDNVAFGLEKIGKEKKQKIVEEHLALVGLSDFADSYPGQLSGGMSQRAAIARGLASDPKILLLDEPFGALDALTRMQLQKDVARIQKEKGITMLLVTHDIEEAIVLGDRIVVMAPGPGQIKDIIPVPANAHRRNSDDFNLIRKKLYGYLFEGADDEVPEDYVI